MELGHVERSFLFHGVSFIFQQTCFISPDRENDKLLSSRRITHTHLGLVASLPHNTPKYEGGLGGTAIRNPGVSRDDWPAVKVSRQMKFRPCLVEQTGVRPLIMQDTSGTRAILGTHSCSALQGLDSPLRFLMSFSRLSSPCFSHTFHGETFAVYACSSFDKNFLLPLEVVFIEQCLRRYDELAKSGYITNCGCLRNFKFL